MLSPKNFSFELFQSGSPLALFPEGSSFGDRRQNEVSMGREVLGKYSTSNTIVKKQ